MQADNDDESFHHIILDTDMGLDDAHCIAGILASSSRCSLDAISTVFGNTSIEQCILNARTLLALLGYKHIPIYQGESKALKNAPVQRIWPGMGENGLGGADFTEIIKSRYAEMTFTDFEEYLPSIQAERAADMLVRLTKENPGKYDILAIGPLTNIAKAIEIDSSFPSNVRSLVWMGGEILPNHPIEFNAICDGYAVKKVMDSWPSKKMTIVPFSLTADAALEWEFYDRLTLEGKSFFSVFLKWTTATYEKFVRGIYIPLDIELTAHDEIPSPRTLKHTNGLEEYARVKQEFISEGKEVLGFSSCDFYAFLSLVYPECINTIQEMRIQAIDIGEQQGALQCGEHLDQGSTQYVVTEIHADFVKGIFQWLASVSEVSKAQLFENSNI